MASTVRSIDRSEDRAGWDQPLATISGGHLLQSWAWGELKADFGWRVHRLSVGSAAAQVLFRPLPAGLGSIAYVPKGPLVDFDDAPGVRRLLDAIRPVARRQRAVCLKIEPNRDEDRHLSEQLRALGFRLSPHEVQPRRTILVDLDVDPDTILARMKQKTRYNIRLAERKGVRVRAGDEADLDAFYGLMERTSERDGFGIHSKAYYEAVHRLFVSSGHGQLLLADYDGQLLAGLVVLAHGDTAIYMYGASSDEERQRMPTYLLQWKAMRWAMEHGCRVYDLWGVPDEDEDTLEAGFTERSDGLWGVYRFKRGFGGHLVRTTGAWDLVYAPLRYWAYLAAVKWLNREETG
jgi:peptidoglycan pentaglycine glycine transferase (the first glycine)